jgi:hypothetical protein
VSQPSLIIYLTFLSQFPSIIHDSWTGKTVGGFRGLVPRVTHIVQYKQQPTDPIIPYSLTHSLTHSLTPWCRTLFEKLIVTQLVQKYHAFFMEPQDSLHAHKSPPVDPILSQLNPVCPTSILVSLRSSLMLSSHLRLGLPNGLLPPGLPTKIL